MRRLALAVAAATMATLVAAPAASADVATDGLWYFDVLNVQNAHSAGYTGEGVTIAVIDTAINPDIATLRDADLRIEDSPECYVDGEPTPVTSDDVEAAGHATNVTSLIVGTGAGEVGGQVGVKGVAPGATVLFYRVDLATECAHAEGQPRESGVGEAIDSAVTAGADIISMSIGFEFNEPAYNAVVRALHEEVILVSSLSNWDDVADVNAWSAWMNGAVSVQAIDGTASIPTHDEGGVEVPNADRFVDVAAPGIGILHQGTVDGGWSGQRLATGTSFAAPIVAGFLAVTSQKYPEATPNQLIQALIHNTGTEDHELLYDANGIGYGVVSLTHLLREDPTQFPDVNPLLIDDGEPTPEVVAAGPEGLEAPDEPSEDPAPDAGDGGLILALVLGTVGVLVAVAVIVTIVLVARRRAQRAT